MCENFLIFVILVASATAAIVKDEKSANAIYGDDSTERGPIDVNSKNLSDHVQVLGKQDPLISVESNQSLSLLNNSHTMRHDRGLSTKSPIGWALLKHVAGSSSQRQFVVSLIRQMNSAVGKLPDRIELMLENFNRLTEPYTEPMILLLRFTVNGIGKIIVWALHFGYYIIEGYISEYGPDNGTQFTQPAQTSTVLA